MYSFNPDFIFLQLVFLVIRIPQSDQQSKPEKRYAFFLDGAGCHLYPFEYLERTFDEEYVLVDYYVDDGLSGTTDYERIDFQCMIHDVEAGKVNCIIVKHFQEFL